LIEAAVAHKEATGKARLLDTGRRAADCLVSVFGPGLRLGYPDHQESELALVRLAGATGEAKYREYAAWQTRARGSRPSSFEAELADPEVVALTPGVKPLYVKNGVYDGAYAQDDVPLVDQTRPVGHAVRAMYFYCGAVDSLGDDVPTMSALERIWTALVSRRMYVTGGIGSSGRNEGFTDDYDLPNLDAYAETCAGIGLVFWAWRMFLHSCNGRYVDVMERALYNAVLSGVSLKCDRYFYDNPLESEGRHERAAWFSCACCPPNIARLLMSIGQYVVGEGDGCVYVAMPVAGSFKTGCGTIEIDANYPWSGDFEVRVSAPLGLRRLGVRVPDWARSGSVSVNGQACSVEPSMGFVVIDREWEDGDTVAVSLEMGARWTAAHSSVLSCAGRVALERGPLVYCLEEHDLGFAPQHWSVDTGASVNVEESDEDRSEVKLIAEGRSDARGATRLYEDYRSTEGVATSARLVPYFSWANRGPNAMQVWLRRSD